MPGSPLPVQDHTTNASRPLRDSLQKRAKCPDVCHLAIAGNHGLLLIHLGPYLTLEHLPKGFPFHQAAADTPSRFAHLQCNLEARALEFVLERCPVIY